MKNKYYKDFEARSKEMRRRWTDPAYRAKTIASISKSWSGRHNTTELFWAKVNKEAPTQSHMKTRCWEWTGGCSGNGYGNFGYQETSKPKVIKQWQAHRYAFFLKHGDIEFGKLICHKCDNPRCVRPSHLFVGTPQANVDDMVSKGRAKNRYG